MFQNVLLSASIRIGILLRTALRRIYDRHPMSRAVIDRTWNTFEIILFEASVLYNTWNYRNERASVDPSLIIEFDPDEIKKLSSGRFHWITATGTIKSGDWDLNSEIFIEGHNRWISFRRHYYNGRPWSQTTFYNNNVEKINSNETAKFETVEALNRKCSEIDNIFKQIEEEGYKRQIELIEDGETGYIGDGGLGFGLNTHKTYLDTKSQ